MIELLLLVKCIIIILKKDKRQNFFIEIKPLFNSRLLAVLQNNLHGLQLFSFEHHLVAIYDCIAVFRKRTYKTGL